MKNESCDKCADVNHMVEIRTPGELARAIRIIRANLEDNTLNDITQPAHPHSGKFLDLENDGPWPDYIEHYFECASCGRRFRLAVDTYHGAGGRWEGGVECY